MTGAADHDRFEELDAGRVLGDLTAEETREWEALQTKLGATPDHGLDLAAAVASEFATGRDEILPAGLADRIRQDIPSAAPDGGGAGNVIRPTLWDRFGRQTGWAVAALLAILLVINSLTWNPAADPPSVAERQAALLRSAPQVVQSAFDGVGDYGDMSGEVVWSDERQEGYMTLTLPANDPTRKQYQLWIVDPERDEAPVDGGVFDIPADGGRVVVPIDAKLAISDPKAFVITLEQPGGVVKSKQEVVVAIANAGA